MATHKTTTLKIRLRRPSSLGSQQDAARSALGRRQQQTAIDICHSRPAARRCCCRSTGQTDGRTPYRYRRSALEVGSVKRQFNRATLCYSAVYMLRNCVHPSVRYRYAQCPVHIARTDATKLSAFVASGAAFTSRCSIKTAERIQIVLTQRLPPTYPIPCYKEIQVSEKNKGILNFATARRSSQRAVNLVRQRSTISTTISGDRRRSTDDRRQFITLSVHLCVQYDTREAARRAGPSATASHQYHDL